MAVRRGGRFILLTPLIVLFLMGGRQTPAFATESPGTPTLIFSFQVLRAEHFTAVSDLSCMMGTMVNGPLVDRIIALALTLFLICAANVNAGGITGEYDPPDPIDTILRAMATHPIVGLAEGGHQADERHQLLRRILGDKAVIEAADVIIVEFANAKHQAVLDAYIRGEDVSFGELSKVWRNTGQSPRGPWDSPLYRQLLEAIRDGNRALPPDKKLRVLAGDPPIDWERIDTRADYAAARIPRDPYAAELAMEQAFEQGKRVLIVFGGAHLPKVPIAPGDLRNSLTSLILNKHPDSVRAFGFLSPGNLGIEDGIDEFEPGKVYATDRHWIGEIDGGLFFQEVYSLVTDASTGEKSWQKVPLYPDYLVRDLFDELIYIGPPGEWTTVPAEFDPERDAEYLSELNRRSLLRFDRSLGN